MVRARVRSGAFTSGGRIWGTSIHGRVASVSSHPTEARRKTATCLETGAQSSTLTETPAIYPTGGAVVNVSVLWLQVPAAALPGITTCKLSVEPESAAKSHSP